MDRPAAAGWEASTRFCPGLILFVQTFGDLLTFNPHIHVLAADGAFRADGVFVVLPAIPVKLLERGFRYGGEGGSAGKRTKLAQMRDRPSWPGGVARSAGGVVQVR